MLRNSWNLFQVDKLKSLGNLKKMEDVLRTATERLPSSVELWQVRLCFHLSRDDEKLGLAVFQDAMARLGSDNETALPLWKVMLQYYQTNDMLKVEQMFQDGIMQQPAISVPLKPLYLEWLVSYKGELTIKLKCRIRQLTYFKIWEFKTVMCEQLFVVLPFYRFLCV